MHLLEVGLRHGKGSRQTTLLKENSGARRSFSRTCPVFRAPAEKYTNVYYDSFETQAYPIQLLGGNHIMFSKVLYKFAENVEGKNFDLYAKDFEKLAEIAAKIGPFWSELDILKDSNFSGLSEGFLFTLGWMQSERMLDSLDQVKASYMELVDAAAGRVRAIITVPYDPSSNPSEIQKIEAEAKAVYAEKKGGSANIVFQYVVMPSLKDGYMFEIDNVVVNKSAAARAASAASSAKEALKDWTAMPALPLKAAAKESPLLLKLIGAELDQLSEIDDVERRQGA